VFAPLGGRRAAARAPAAPFSGGGGYGWVLTAALADVTREVEALRARVERGEAARRDLDAAGGAAGLVWAGRGRAAAAAAAERAREEAAAAERAREAAATAERALQAEAAAEAERQRAASTWERGNRASALPRAL